MDSLIDRLQHQTDELDQTELDPTQHLSTVVRRGRRYRALVSTLGAVGVTAVVAGGAVALPRVVELLQGPAQPTVVSTPEVEPVPETDPVPVPEEATRPAVEREGPAAAPVEEPPAIDAVPPALEVLAPADGAVVTSEQVTFRGTTEPGASVVVGAYEAEVDAEGRWSLLLIAAEGGNQVTVEATDTAGNTTVRTTSVTYRPPVKPASATVDQPSKDTGSKDPTKDTAKQQPGEDAMLTASQQSDVLSTPPHKNLYRGTAAPGAKVAVVSEHGAGYVWADEAGQWEVLVDFDPPGGETTFPVSVKLYHQPAVARTFQLTTVAQEAAAFTAGQQSTTVPVGDPTNTYSGTGEPGHEIWIWTELHGQATTVVGADGTWQVSMTYSAVAPGDVFAVKAKDLDTGERHVFEVTVE